MYKKNVRNTIIILLVLIISLTGCTRNSHLNDPDVTEKRNEQIGNSDIRDFQLIRERLISLIMNENYRYYNMSENVELIRLANKEICLSEIDYENQQASFWQAIRHLEYTMSLVKQNNIADDDGIRKTAIGLINYWIENDYQNDKNWYYNQIGIPLDLADISLIMLDYLDKKQIDKISVILNRGTIGRGTDAINVHGSNGSDFIRISIANAIITNDNVLLSQAVECLNSIIKFGDYKKNGIQNDMTYIGNTVLYGGSAYPITFLTNTVQLAALINGTEYVLLDENKRLIVDFLLDGQRFFHRNNGVPNFALGRSAYQASGGEALQDITTNIIELNWGYRLDDLEHYLNSFEDKSSVEKKVKYFPIGGMLVDVAEDSYIAVRGYQSDISMTNIQNDEGVLNYNFCYGSNTCYMDIGDEYSSIADVFDWSMLPGTTTYIESDKILYERFVNDYNKTWGHIEHVKTYPPDSYGDVDNNIYAGVMISPLSHDGISGKNIFIMYDECLFCLGTGFCSTDYTDKSIVTTINQCISDGSIKKFKSLSRGECIENGSFVYTNLCEYILKVQDSVQSGTISRTVLTYEDGNNNHSKRVFKCFFDWGNKMDNIDYAYGVSPKNRDSNISVVKVVNTADCQLIEFSDGTLLGNVDKPNLIYEGSHSSYELQPGICIKSRY